MTLKRRIVFVAILLRALPIVGLAVLSATTKRPVFLGVRDGRLAPCLGSPNCVSTQGEDDKHCLAPIVCALSNEDALRCLKSVLASWPRVIIVSEGRLSTRRVSHRLVPLCG